MEIDPLKEVKSLNVSKQLFRNTIFGWFEMGILLVSGFIIPPLLLSRLGKEGYGLWLLIGQLTAYLPILDLGVSSSVGRFVAKYNAKKDFENLSQIISSSIFLFLFSSVCTVIITIIIWPNFSKFFNLSPEYFKIGRWLILLTGFGIAIDFPFRIGGGVLQGFHRFDLMYLLRASGAFVKLLFIVVLFGFLKCKSLIILGMLAVGVTIFTDLIMCRYAYIKTSSIVKLKYTLVKLSSLKEIWSLSLSALLITIATLLFNQGQILGVGKIIGTEAVTIYAIPIMLLTYGSMVIAYIVGAFKPMASHMQALNEKIKLQKLNIAGVKISFSISLFIAILSIVFGYPFFKIWLHASKDLSNSDFALLSNVLKIMVIGFAVGVPQNVTAKMLSGMEKQWFIAFISLVASLLGFCIGTILMMKTNLGFYGMAIGWAAVFIMKGVFVLPISACRHFGIKSLLYIKEAYLPPMIAASIIVVIAYILRATLDMTSIIIFALCIILSVSIYAVAVYAFCLNKEQRIQIHSMLRKQPRT